MRITNTTSEDIILSDLDRGNAGTNDPNTGIYEAWNTKTQSVVPANDFIDVFDTDRVMLSTDLGQIKKFKDLGTFTTEYSMTGREVGPFVIDGSNNTFEVDIGGGGFQSFTLPSGGEVTMSQIVTAINTSATGFVSEESNFFFRSSNTDDVTPGLVRGIQGDGYGQRTPSIVSGFLVLVSSGVVTIGGGTANDTLGFIEGMKTTSK